MCARPVTRLTRLTRGTRLGRLALSTTLSSLAIVGLGAACKGTPEIGFQISLPSDLVAQTAWFEIGAFRDARCAALRPMLASGVPDGFTTRVAFSRDDKTSPKIGDLPRASYAFAAVAKDEHCAVIASGCVESDVGSVDSVAVSMRANDPPTGACGIGASCQAARCAPANDNADPSVGAGCSLELLGAGPLANPVGGGGTVVSAPAIAATPSGFVVVYRESNEASARVTVLPIDPAGGADVPARPRLLGRCSDEPETDGVGLIMNGSDGQVMLARAPCGAKSGLELLSFASRPEVEVDTNFLSSDSTAARILLSPGHVATSRGTTGVVAFTVDGAARLATVDRANGIGAPSGSFGGLVNMTGAWVAASDKVLAVLAAGPPKTAADAGADGGNIDGSAELDPEETPMLRLVMAPAETSLSDFDVEKGLSPAQTISFPGDWGAVAARGTRVIVLSSGGGPGRSATYRTFDVEGREPQETNGFSVDNAGEITTGDLYIQDNRVFFAVLREGVVELHAYANASTTPTPLRSLSFAKEPRIPAINIVRDGRVAVAATDTRVAVAWTTGAILTNNDTTGGYAVFACTP